MGVFNTMSLTGYPLAKEYCIMEIDGSKKVTKVTDKERSMLDESKGSMDMDPKVKMLREIIGCLVVPVFALKNDLSIIAINQEMEDLTGYNMEEARERTFLRLSTHQWQGSRRSCLRSYPLEIPTR